jgi:hypothetical protein
MRRSCRPGSREQDLDVIQTNWTDENTFIHIYLKYQNIPILVDRAFPEFRIGFSIVRNVEDMLFFYDIEGKRLQNPKSLQRIPTSKLQVLFAGRGARLAEVTLLNTDLGRTRIRIRTIRAYSIYDTAPSLADHLQICSTAIGRLGTRWINRSRLYVGFTRGRISNRSSDDVNFEDYTAWLDDVARALRNPTKKQVALIGSSISYLPHLIILRPTSCLIWKK